ILGTDFDESPAQMVNRVCREVGSKKNIVVINDEAHHCYRRKPDGEPETLKGEDRTEAEKRNEEARVWISGLEAVRDKIGIRAFGTQLLCEQVVGRALRRMSYAANAEAKFEPEYADVYGVPFSFLPCSGTTKVPKP